MKKIKNTLIITSYVLLVALFFASGYALGKKNNVNEPNETVVEEDNIAAGTDTVFDAPTYEVVYEDGEIKINRCIGDIKETIVGEAISERVFPSEDITELKRGVSFKRLESAQQMFENFVS